MFGRLLMRNAINTGEIFAFYQKKKTNLGGKIRRQLPPSQNFGAASQISRGIWAV
jgi:hypothetical protein